MTWGEDEGAPGVAPGAFAQGDGMTMPLAR